MNRDENNDGGETHKSADKIKDNGEDYVTKCMGAFGVWQAGVCTIAASIRFMTMWNMLSIIYLTPATNFRCVNFETNASVDIKNSTCYDNCVEYEFEKNIFDYTLVSEFGLICEDAWLAKFTQTILMFGLLVGVSCFGWISDRFGRRKALMISAIMNIIFMAIAPFSPTFLVFICLRFFIGVATGGTLIIGIVYLLEIVGTQYREAIGTLAVLPDGFAEVSLAAFAYYSPTWRTYMLGYTSVSILLVILVLLLPETPRWLVSKGKGDEAIEVMTRAALRNKLDTTQIRDNVTRELDYMKLSGMARNNTNYLDLFGTKDLAFKTIAVIVIWTSAGACYFGINQYVTFIGSNLYITVILLGCIQVPMCPLAMFVNKMFGRKATTITSLLVTGVTMMGLIFVPQEHWACTALGIIGFGATSITFAVTYVYITELFPTPLRNKAYGLSSVGSKIGAMVSPFIATIRPHWIASSVFGVLPFVASMFCWFLPETKGLKLRDTLS